MELVSLAVVAGATGLSALVGAHAEALVSAVEHTLRQSNGADHRLVVESGPRDDNKAQADLRLD